MAKPAACILVGAPCYVRFPGRGPEATDWMIAEVVIVEPLTARVLADHQVYRGALVQRKDALIRVDPRHWPEGRQELRSESDVPDDGTVFELTDDGWRLADGRNAA